MYMQNPVLTIGTVFKFSRAHSVPKATFGTEGRHDEPFLHTLYQ